LSRFAEALQEDEENAASGAWNLIHVVSGDKIEKNEMGWACGAYG